MKKEFIKKNFSNKKKLLLDMARQYCDMNDKSVEFTLEYMQDVAKASLEEVLEFLQHCEKT